MAVIQWDRAGERLYETGVDRGVLYIPNSTGSYEKGYAWNGLTSVSESPSGAEPNAQYADNIKYLNLISTEEFGATIEAFTYPEEFAQCDGTALIAGVQISQQVRKSFGFSYRTLVGNDLVGTDFGYKVHLVYGCDAQTSEKTRSTVNDTPEAATFSWEITTNPVNVAGINPGTGKPFRPTSHLVINSTDVTPQAMQALEDILYGTADAEPRMPAPDEVLGLFAADAGAPGDGGLIQVVPVEPTWDDPTLTIPEVEGLIYRIGGSVVEGTFDITVYSMVESEAVEGYVLHLPEGVYRSWSYMPFPG